MPGLLRGLQGELDRRQYPSPIFEMKPQLVFLAGDWSGNHAMRRRQLTLALLLKARKVLTYLISEG